MDAGRATLLFALVYLNLNFAVFGGFQLETPQAFFTALAAAAGLEALRDEDRRDAFAVGLCAGTAAMLKPSGLAVGAAFALAVICAASSWRAVLKLGVASFLGLLLPLIMAVIYLAAADNLQTCRRWRSRFRVTQPARPGHGRISLSRSSCL